METINFGKLQRTKDRSRPEVSKQTGFTSAATHYYEQPIDLHKELMGDQDATYFIRVEGNGHQKFNILDKDVLLVDRSLHPIDGRLCLVAEKGEFSIVRFSNKTMFEDQMHWGVITYIIHRAQ
ncbi:MAG TPA: S24 family peptidase [Flavobacteriaceae bacterium]|nr:S24 family peptidase [Flavobacteriaceae bacterium]